VGPKPIGAGRWKLEVNGKWKLEDVGSWERARAGAAQKHAGARPEG
jgi:hypothetical protein